MLFGKIRNLLSLNKKAKGLSESEVAMPAAQASGKAALPHPEVPLIAAADSPWGVPLLDLRPVTLSAIATSADPLCAQNSISYGHEDGLAFVGQAPMISSSCAANLVYRIDRLADGVLFKPRNMDQKWAIFLHDRKIICVRSWLRRVAIVAHLEVTKDTATITRIDGAFLSEDEEPAFTERMLDFLLRSHVLKLPYPVPLTDDISSDPQKAAMWSFGLFGNLAAFGTTHSLPREVPEQMLRSHSLLHLAVAWGQKDNIARFCRTIPFDQLAGDGLTPLQWSLACEDETISEFLLDLGCPVDVRSAQGATTLMNVVQTDATDNRAISRARMLLERGADPNAQDNRGFTALHRCAEMGLSELVDLLLEYRADPNIEAEGHTAKSLAEACHHVGIVSRLRTY